MKLKFILLLNLILTGLLLQPVFASAQNEDCVDMGGTANLFSMNGEHGIGAMTGTIDGAAYGKATAHKDIGNNRIEISGFHYFLDKDGSHFYTHDKAVMQMNLKTGVSIFQTTYNVMNTSGRFAGMEGSFNSSGWIKDYGKDGHARGVVRFEGRLCRD